MITVQQYMDCVPALFGASGDTAAGGGGGTAGGGGDSKGSGKGAVAGTPADAAERRTLPAGDFSVEDAATFAPPRCRIVYDSTNHIFRGCVLAPPDVSESADAR